VNFQRLTSKELESILEAIDAFHAAYDLVQPCMDDDDELTTEELRDAIITEMTDRAYSDAGFIISQHIARGEVERYMRPDGEIGYAPPGAWDELP